MLPQQLRYTKEHEWAVLEDGRVKVGVTDHAQEQLTEIVFVELPALGRHVQAGDAVVALESVKSVSDVYSPVAGEIVEVNRDLESTPAQVNTSPYEEGWLFKVVPTEPSSLEHLLDAHAYAAHIGEAAD